MSLKAALTRGLDCLHTCLRIDAGTGRTIVALIAFGLGFTRILALPSQPVDILPSNLYGALLMTLAVGLAATVAERTRWQGRAFAILGAALFAAFTFDLIPTSPASAWTCFVLAAFLVLEAAYVDH